MSQRSRTARLCALLSLAGLILIGLLSGCGPAGTVADIVEALTPSTVLIYAEFPHGSGTGTGIIYDESGLTVTNAHVVEGAAIIEAYVQGIDRWLSAELVGLSTSEDLAVIDISGEGYVAATLGDSDELTLGEDVIALGYPLASALGADLTINRGVVSKLHVELDEFQDLIQTDTDINPGNSGGPLVNMRGEVIGINTTKIEYTPTGRPVSGINFAIPSSYARPIIERLAWGSPAATPEPPTITPTPAWPSQTPEGEPVKGSPDAPVTIIEYTEYQCPFCARFVQETLPLIEENYITTGKVRLIFRNFPVHQQAVFAAGAAVCAQEQDEFWQMHDTLFAQQGEWSGDPDFMVLFEGYAKDMGLDTEQFTSCLIPEEGKEPEWLEKLKKDFEAGQEAGVQGTPSFFISDQSIVGAQPFEVFQEAIEQELAK